MGSIAGAVVGSAAAWLGLTTTRRDRGTAVRVGERACPGRLRVVAARTLFPRTTGSEITFALTDDPDAVARVRVERGTLGEEAVREAVALARTRADTWRHLSAAFRSGGYDIHGLGSLVADPWVCDDITNDTVRAVLDRLAACAGGTAPGSVLVAAPDVVLRLPPPDPGVPTLLRLTERRRLAALSGHRAYHRVWYDPRGASVSVVRPFEEQRRYDAAVEASAGEWLATALPGAAVTAAMSVSRLVPGRADRVRGYVVFRDASPDDPVSPGNHALLVTTDLAGRLTAAPTVLRDVREGRGPLRLPPLQDVP